MAGSSAVAEGRLLPLQSYMSAAPHGGAAAGRYCCCFRLLLLYWHY